MREPFKVVNPRGRYDTKSRRHVETEVSIEDAVKGTLEYDPYDNLGKFEKLDQFVTNQRNFTAKLVDALVKSGKLDAEELAGLLEYPFQVRKTK